MTARRYGIGALSRDTGCNVETIRYYERIGLLPAPPRSDGGHRSFSPEAAKRVSFIVRSRELGFSIPEIRELLGLVDRGKSCEEVRAVTISHIEAIRTRIADLKRLEDVLQDAAADCEGGNIPECPIVHVLFGQGQ